ncbi:MAG TPA: hypothetical protein VJ911_00885, partial [Cryomorphaceae bacterium]|nr:hypothetical protein [Cryomorphaceae bacterium]
QGVQIKKSLRMASNLGWFTAFIPFRYKPTMPPAPFPSDSLWDQSEFVRFHFRVSFKQNDFSTPHCPVYRHFQLLMAA